jgi:hypothetical protein
MGRPRKRSTTLLYVEIGLSNGTRYRIGMGTTQPKVEEIQQHFDGLDRVTSSGTIEQFIVALETESQVRTLTTGDDRP